jgi:hypothetical protein
LGCLCIPENVDFIHGSAFVGAKFEKISVHRNNKHFAMDQDFLIDRFGAKAITHFGKGKAFVSNSIKTLGTSCRERAMVATFLCELHSQLRPIESRCFTLCHVKSIRIAPSLDSIDGSAFVRGSIESISVDEGNHRFVMDRDFLVNREKLILVRYFGQSKKIVIWKEIEAVGKSCFEQATIEDCTFEPGLQLGVIEERSFRGSSLKSIWIPRSVRALGNSAFLKTRTRAKFEKGSQLAHVSESCFSGYATEWLCIP